MKKHDSSEWIWWKHGVIYHIYPRSFQDSNGDGAGDLRGIIRRLGYLKELGVDGIWLSPVYSSPMVDYGYDVSDYLSIDPSYGTMDDFRELIESAHAAGIRVIMDMVLNHTSEQHPWFIESSSSRENPRRSWYIWRDSEGGGPPNNWRSAVGGSAWTLAPRTGEYYLHSFFKEQPDLNWREKEVEEAFTGILRTWMDAGVDGFRFDVINMIVKDRKFRNNPFSFRWPSRQEHRYTRDRGRSLKIVRRLRKVLDEYPDRVGIGEVYVIPPGNPANAARYLLNGNDGLHLAFDFSLIFSFWNAHAFYNYIHRWYQLIPEGGWPCLVFSNHDLFRSINRVPWRVAKEQKAKIAAVLLMTLKGTPFIYYGEEIGMHNTPVSYKEIRDPMGKRYWPFFTGRDRARTPMQWSDETHAGFSERLPWLPVNRDYKKRNVRIQEAGIDSLLNLYRRLIKLRHEVKSLSHGEWIPVYNGKGGILAYFRRYEDDHILVVLNFTRKEKTLNLTGEMTGQVLLSVQRSDGERCHLQQVKIYPYEATVFRVME
jgi:alpha-glucosidase